MNFTYKISEMLPEDAKNIREEVFVKEQGFSLEFDDIDARALHIVLYDNEVPIGVCRIYKESDNDKFFIAGRIAVLIPYRGSGAGRELMKVIENEARARGVTEVRLSAQVRVSGFYKGCGYESYGDEYLDEYCPHIMMRKSVDG